MVHHPVAIEPGRFKFLSLPFDRFEDLSASTVPIERIVVKVQLHVHLHLAPMAAAFVNLGKQ
jgi:hypothetical protein